MLRSLLIRNFALIEHTEIQFGRGLNIITGETGAGKSILIGALNMVLGERAQSHVIRSGADKAIAEAVFEIDAALAQQLQEMVVAEDQDALDIEAGDLILRRQLKSGSSRAFINDTPVSIQLLRKVGDRLVDLHGQHDHQLLLKPEYHRLVVDQTAWVQPHFEQYKSRYASWLGLKQSLDNLQKKQKQLHEKIQLYEFQFNELEAAGLYAEEEQELLDEMKKLDHAEESEQLAVAAAQIIQDDEAGIVYQIRKLQQFLEQLEAIDQEVGTYLEEVKAAKVSLAEAGHFLLRYQEGIVSDPVRLEALRQRHRQLRQLEKKYAMSISELIQHHAFLGQELKEVGGFEQKIEELTTELKTAAQLLGDSALNLHNARLEAQDILCRKVEQKLKEMSIPHARIELRVELRSATSGIPHPEGGFLQCDALGADEVWFELSMNKGEELGPLAEIASGGEISRVMLAFKDAMADHSQLPVMVFDEIDAGISGSVSEQVGRVMRGIAGKIQILAITHQPQIASQADHHYQVQKEEQNERITSKIRPLNESEHIREVAALMSGATITEATLASAKELIEQARKA